MSDLERRGGREMAVASIGATFAALLAAGTGPLAPFVAAAVTPLTTRMTELARAEWGRKSDVIADSAFQASGLGTPEEFCEALAGNPEMIALTHKILWAASVSGNDLKLRALGALVGGVVASRGDRLDETQLLLNALADLEAPHAVILELIAKPAPDEEEQRPRSRDSEPIGWLSRQVQAEVRMDGGFVLACLNGLTRHGLATAIGVYGGVDRYVITDLGCALVKVMRGPSSERAPL